MDEQADVVVIGAGAAGLMAASLLRDAGVHVLVLETKERVGGRINSLHRDGLPAIELGAALVHGEPTETLRLADRAGVGLTDVAATKWEAHNGRFVRQDRFLDELFSVLGRLDEAVSGETFSRFIELHAHDASPHALEVARRYVENFNAADARDVSAWSVLETEMAVEQMHGERLRFLDGPHERLLRPLLHGVEVRLGARVQRIAWRHGHVTIEGMRLRSGKRFSAQARCVVVTVPLGVLQRPGALQFLPAIRTKEGCVERLRMGHVIKTLLHVDDGGRLPMPEAMVYTSSTPFPVWWRRGPLVTAWVGGAPSAALIDLAEADIRALAIEQLASMCHESFHAFGARVREVFVSDWHRDPATMGAYSYAAVGGEHAFEELARPVDDTLFYAGEATQSRMSGTVEAALASGVRAAGEVKDALLRGRRAAGL